MKLKIIAFGTRLPDWLCSGFSIYQQRMPASLPLVLVELPIAKRSDKPDTKRLLEQEASLMMKRISASDYVVALDVTGASSSTESLAKRLDSWCLDGRDVCLLIGGPDGLGRSCLDRANWRLSLSAMTLPHGLARVVLAEQLYRAWSINNNHPYHRA